MMNDQLSLSVLWRGIGYNGGSRTGPLRTRVPLAGLHDGPVYRFIVGYQQGDTSESFI